MRNYLPIPEPERIHRRIGRRLYQRLRPFASPIIALFILISAFGMSGMVRADNAQLCNGKAGTQVVFTDPSVGGATYPASTVRTDQWVSDGTSGGPFNTNMVYRVYEFYSHAEPPGNPAANGDFCTTQFTVDTNNAFYKFNNQRAVNIRLGVPNMGADNYNGLWRLNQGFGSVDNFRPPKTMRNFDSQAVFNDDGGMFTMHSARFNLSNGHQNFYKVWCKNWDASVGMPGADDAGGCGVGDSNGPDITTFADGSNSGAGYMSVQDNCHLNDLANGFGATYNKDSDGALTGPCVNDGTNTGPWDSYYGNYFAANAAAGVLFHPNLGWCGCGDPMFNLSFKDFLGCSGGPCDGLSQPIDAFNVNQYARNHVTNNPDAHITSAATDLTFAYPLPAKLDAGLSTSGCATVKGNVIQSGDTLHTYGCASYPPAGESFMVTLTNQTVNGFTHAGNLDTARPVTVMVQLPATTSLTAITPITTGTCATQAPVYDNVLNRLTWTLTVPQVGSLNNSAPVYFCFNGTAGTTAGNFNVTATPSGFLRYTGLATTNISHTNTNTVVSASSALQQQPFLFAAHAGGGDINAGGYIGNCGSGTSSGYAGSGSNAVRGSVSNRSAGLDLITGGGNISAFPSYSGLGIPNYYNVCRPDLAAAADYAIAHPSASGPQLIDATAYTPAQIDTAINASYGSHGALIYMNNPPPNNYGIGTTGVLSPHSRVTFYLKCATCGVGIVNSINGGSIYGAGSSVLTSQLASFGLITTGSIFITSNVNYLNGNFYAQGSYPAGQIVECSNNAYPYQPWDYQGGLDPDSKLPPPPPNRISDFLMAFCTTPGNGNHLTLNGSFSAHTFVFNRVGPTNTDGPFFTEDFATTGTLFLAPPPIFDGTTPGSATSTIMAEPPQY